MKNTILKPAVIHAVATAAYIALVATFLSNTPKIFGPDEPKSVLVPIAMISLLVFSAALTGILVLGRPVLWYLDGKKKEALALLFATLGAFFVLMLSAFLALFLTR